ncbi:hypothetical protein HXX76_011652 [Chlamydomonas incerta]|uniref:Uncharacterized protein n=1 Tax=Chlamydomonas incerta TaxID=51695 RepID=A0A835SDP9_CHLIN|nr:hypothetical protein HXX76_011652 [Chlamydomonas incerta]|eukprot:KAG2422837.1 hypothetical protein HXX76_011652 [Chlamydomonas incerta]
MIFVGIALMVVLGAGAIFGLALGVWLCFTAWLAAAFALAAGCAAAGLLATQFAVLAVAGLARHLVPRGLRAAVAADAASIATYASTNLWPAAANAANATATDADGHATAGPKALAAPAGAAAGRGGRGPTAAIGAAAGAAAPATPAAPSSPAAVAAADHTAAAAAVALAPPPPALLDSYSHLFDNPVGFVNDGGGGSGGSGGGGGGGDAAQDALRLRVAAAAGGHAHELAWLEAEAFTTGGGGGLLPDGLASLAGLVLQRGFRLSGVAPAAAAAAAAPPAAAACFAYMAAAAGAGGHVALLDCLTAAQPPAQPPALPAMQPTQPPGTEARRQPRAIPSAAPAPPAPPAGPYAKWTRQPELAVRRQQHQEPNLAASRRLSSAAAPPAAPAVPAAAAPAAAVPVAEAAAPAATATEAAAAAAPAVRAGPEVATRRGWCHWPVVLMAAAGADTPDWAAKVLCGFGCSCSSRGSRSSAAASAPSDAVAARNAGLRWAAEHVQRLDLDLPLRRLERPAAAAAAAAKSRTAPAAGVMREGGDSALDAVEDGDEEERAWVEALASAAGASVGIVLSLEAAAWRAVATTAARHGSDLPLLRLLLRRAGGGVLRAAASFRPPGRRRSTDPGSGGAGGGGGADCEGGARAAAAVAAEAWRRRRRMRWLVPQQLAGLGRRAAAAAAAAVVEPQQRRRRRHTSARTLPSAPPPPPWPLAAVNSRRARPSPPASTSGLPVPGSHCGDGVRDVWGEDEDSAPDIGVGGEGPGMPRAAAGGAVAAQPRSIACEDADLKPDRAQQPWPGPAFVAHWGRREPWRTLTLPRRRLLLCLAASSGHAASLDAALAHCGCTLTPEVLTAAAAAGNAAGCERLLGAGCGVDSRTVKAAAEAGHLPVLQLLEQNTHIQNERIVFAEVSAEGACAGGHANILAWVQRAHGYRPRHTDAAAAARAGQVAMLELLLPLPLVAPLPPPQQHESPPAPAPATAAAGDGDCFRLDHGLLWGSDAVAAAEAGDALGTGEFIRRADRRLRLLLAINRGCPVEVLQRLYEPLSRSWLPGRPPEGAAAAAQTAAAAAPGGGAAGGEPDGWCSKLLPSALGSPTSCWAAKLDFLLAAWGPAVTEKLAREETVRDEAVRAASITLDCLQRLQWLRSHGVQFSARAAASVGLRGHAEALAYLRDEAALSPGPEPMLLYLAEAAEPVAEPRRGAAVDLAAVAEGGSEEALDWAAAELEAEGGALQPLSHDNARRLTYRGNTATLTWLRSRGLLPPGL